MRIVWCLVAIAACSSNKKGPPPAPPPTPVQVEALAPTPVIDSTEYLATLRSRTAATIQPQVDGQIRQILVKPGDIVTAGQPLFQIDPGRTPAALSQAQASLSGWRAALALAEQNLARVEGLVKTGALPRQELDNAQSAATAARSDVAALGAEIQGSRVQLNYYRVVALVGGQVGDVPVRVGDRVSPVTALTSITNNRMLEANVSVPVARAADVAIGTEVQLVDENAKVLGTAKVSFISAQVDSQTQAVLVKANVDNASGALRADQVVRARVVWRSHDGFVVSALTIVRRGAQAFVFVATDTPQGTVAKQKPIQLGDLIDRGYIVTGGLAAGEKIIVSNIQKLGDGAPVAVSAAPPPSAGSGSGAAAGSGSSTGSGSAAGAPPAPKSAGSGSQAGSGSAAAGG